MYVANSEPTIWQRGGGRSRAAERDLISGEPNRCEVRRDTGKWCVLPREALLCWGLGVAKDPIKPNREGDPEVGQGAEGGRFAGSTEDSGPMKPGNSVEDKTLTTGRKKKTGRFSTENPPLATVNTHLIQNRS